MAQVAVSCPTRACAHTAVPCSSSRSRLGSRPHPTTGASVSPTRTGPLKEDQGGSGGGEPDGVLVTTQQQVVLPSLAVPSCDLVCTLLCLLALPLWGQREQKQLSTRVQQDRSPSQTESVTSCRNVSPLRPSTCMCSEPLGLSLPQREATPGSRGLGLRRPQLAPHSSFQHSLRCGWTQKSVWKPEFRSQRPRIRPTHLPRDRRD